MPVILPRDRSRDILHFASVFESCLPDWSKQMTGERENSVIQTHHTTGRRGRGWCEKETKTTRLTKRFSEGTWWLMFAKSVCTERGKRVEWKKKAKRVTLFSLCPDVAEERLGRIRITYLIFHSLSPDKEQRGRGRGVSQKLSTIYLNCLNWWNKWAKWESQWAKCLNSIPALCSFLLFPFVVHHF